MGQSAAGLARDIARSLVDVLAAYEKELTVLERETPSVAPLREALGLAIVDARHVISVDAPEGVQLSSRAC
jgi:hypothetical protein